MGIVRIMFFGWAGMFRFMFVWVRGKFGTGDIQNIFVFKGGGDIEANGIILNH